jgi:hypothetical protein
MASRVRWEVDLVAMTMAMTSVLVVCIKGMSELMRRMGLTAYTTNRLAPPSPRHQALSCLGLPRGLGGLGA